MTERMSDERLDHEIRGFLAGQAEEVAGAPSATVVALRISERAGTATAGRRVAPQVAWVVLAGLLVFALLGALATGANRPQLAPPFAVTSDVTPSAVPDSTESPSASRAPIPSAAATLPRLSLPRSRGGPPGEYGWEGGAGERAGMHLVIEDPGDIREATAMIFAVGADCLTASREQRTSVRVAGFDGVSVEPYEPPVPFNNVGDEITRAYALAVGDRTLCVYLTWHPTTTTDELGAAVRILDTLRAEPIGEDRIRVVFTLEDEWDTG